LISDLDFQIKQGKKIVRAKTPPPTDAELDALRVQRDALKKQFDETFGKPELTDAQRAAKESANLDRQIAEVQRQLKEGDIFPESPKRKPTTPEIEAKRAELEALKSEREWLRDATQPEPRDTNPEIPRLNQLKARLDRQIADKTKRIAEGDFNPNPRPSPTTLDAEATRKTAELRNLEQQFELARRSAQLKQRSMPQKILDFFSKWMRREFVLSSPSSILKLTSAAIQGLGFEPVKEVVGKVISKALPGFETRLRVEAPSSVRIEAKALKDAFTKVMDESALILKTGKGQNDLVFGGKNAIPQEMVSYFGRLHAVLKNPLKRAAFTRVFEKLVEQEMRNGVDVTDPLVQMRMGTVAMKEANRMLFLEDNVLVNAYRSGLGRLEAKVAGTGKPSPVGLVAGAALRFTIPIVRIPTNLVARTIQAAIGFPVGATKLAFAYSKGIKELPTESADLIMRQMKQGSPGGVMLLLGYFLPQMFGGYYQPREKRAPGDVGPGKLRVGSVDIPAVFQHHPLLQVAQLGATIRRVADSHIRKKDKEAQGLGAGVMAGLIGLTEEVPFGREIFDAAKLQEPASREKWLDDYIRSAVVPQGLQWVARETDKVTPFNPFEDATKRNPTNLLQNLKTGIPGLREQVPVKKK